MTLGLNWRPFRLVIFNIRGNWYAAGIKPLRKGSSREIPTLGE
jgi:hypothetical protein